MPDSTQDHYDRLADSYDQNWVHSAEFISWMNGRISDRLDVKPGDRVVDLGCGTGLFSTALAERAGDVACVDPSTAMLENIRTPASGRLIPINATAEAIATRQIQLPFDEVDALLVKEAIHHVDDRATVLAGLATLLAPGGRILVVMLPTTISYPLFRQAIEIFTRQQPDPEDIAMAMRAEGLTTTLSYDSFHLVFPRGRYLAMVRNRYMSLLSEFDDDELQFGIREIERSHPQDVLEFDDRFAFVLGKHA